MKTISDSPAKKVLLVEDNPVDFAEFTQLLAQLNYTVIQKPDLMPVSSYEDAIRILQSEEPIEFALLDVNLKGEKTGVDVAEYIIKNGYPIKIIFTTAYLSPENANDIAFIGTQFGTIPKPSGIVDSTISLFNLRQVIAPVNPLQNKMIDNVFVNGVMINPRKSITEQLKDDRLRYSTRVIAKKSIYYIFTGTTSLKVPKNKSLIITEYPKEAVLANASLDRLLADHLDDRFVRINENTCINLEYYEGGVSKTSGLEISVVGFSFTVTKNYRTAFRQKLIRYGLVPT
jgi:CheY-like chemotaxis protein